MENTETVKEDNEKKKINLRKIYTFEIQKITNKLHDLEEGRIYEFTKYGQDGYLSTNISKLKEMLNDLLHKIEFGENSIKDELNDLFRKSDI